MDAGTEVSGPIAGTNIPSLLVNATNEDGIWVQGYAFDGAHWVRIGDAPWDAGVRIRHCSRRDTKPNVTLKITNGSMQASGLVAFK